MSPSPPGDDRPSPLLRLLAALETVASRLVPPKTVYSSRYRRSAAGQWRSLRELAAYRAALAPRRAAPAAPGPLRLVYVLHNSKPYASGGYATRAAGVLKGLAAHGIDVTVVTRPGFPEEGTTQGASEERLGGIMHRRIARPASQRIMLDAYVPRAAAAFEREFRAGGFTHVLSASFADTCGLPALIAARRLGLPFFYEVRGLREVTQASRQANYDTSFIYRFNRALEHLVCSEADHVFTLTGAMREELMARGLDGGRISLVPNACDVERFTPRPRDADFAADLGIAPATPVIGYVGTLADYEGLDDLAAAAGLLRRQGRDFRLLLVGGEYADNNRTGPVTEKIRATIAAEGLEPFVIMPGRVPHDQVERYYSLIDVAPFPRKPWLVCEMVSPMKPLEAMAMEKMVLVSSVAALAEMVRHGETGWVYEKGSTAKLAEALAALLADPALRRRIGAAARRWVAAERTWQSATAIMAQRLRGPS